MARVTRRTLRKLSPLARRLAEQANTLQSASDAIMRLALGGVTDAERDAEALGAYLAQIDPHQIEAIGEEIASEERSE